MQQTYLLASVGIVAVMAVVGFALVFADSDYAMAQHECHHMGPSARTMARGDMASIPAMMGGGMKDSMKDMMRMMDGDMAALRMMDGVH